MITKNSDKDNILIDTTLLKQYSGRRMTHFWVEEVNLFLV